MRSGHPASSSAQTDLFSFANLVTLGDLDRRQVHINAHKALAVIDDHAVTLVKQRTCENNLTRICRQYRCPWFSAEVHPPMDGGQLPVEGSSSPKRLRHG